LFVRSSTLAPAILVIASLLAPRAHAAGSPAGAGLSAAEHELRVTLEEILRTPELEQAAVGIHVRSLQDGHTLFDRNAGKLFNPASNQKIVTSAAALWYLGPNYRWKTQAFRDLKAPGGHVAGNLYVKGFGDPMLTTEELFGFVNDIALHGIAQVDGDLVVDDTFFDDVFEGPGWDQERSDQSYAPPIGALSTNFGTFTLRVLPGDGPGTPGRVLVWPDVPLVEIASEVETAGRSTRPHVWVGTTWGDQGKVKVSIRGAVDAGDGEGLTLYRRVRQPSLYAGETLKHLLELRGVHVKGKVKTGKVPRTDVVLIATHLSAPLADILSTLNKFSSNFIAEQVVKTLGAELRGAPGTWAKGCDVMSAFMEEIGVPRGAYVLGNGSGLNDVNRVTPEQLTRILEAMYRRFEVTPEFVGSLAVAGISGTIHGRFEDGPAAQRLRAKTGSLRGVSALSGYVATRNNTVLAFSVIMNDFATRSSVMRHVQDRIGNALAAFQTADVIARP
jgi:D-alanyl-D-alanine carboxypeptidase/D-alanyl-D-alanine-endopeptidase (penicillin-binding protein 4)